ncbi:uncharacterized protein LOC107661332 isoform X2 [Sinocyclocheilus anshuiensis]|uniref:uncharacterized protein LOC107661332 isoform X2 n=1 Tax=Sinocyclocheilus anshuiensis TaxID=1608454 RepID=UPI0007B9B59C|nr:PREDICTED: uncharacterized protein LOC107661332 isoform X2 [Sinocyclocheilus anshuiensis]
MANFQTRILRLDLCVVIILRIHADYSKSNQEQRIRQHINKIVFVEETVTLHCNKTQFDDDFTWKMNNSVIFRQDSERNRTMRNFSSNRININPAAPRELTIHQIQASDAGNYSCYPAAMRWTLTITENQIRPESPKQMPLSIVIIIIIIISCCGVIMICLIITVSICIQRKSSQKINSGSEKQDVKMISDCDKHTITACVYNLHKVS